MRLSTLLLTTLLLSVVLSATEGTPKIELKTTDLPATAVVPVEVNATKVFEEKVRLRQERLEQRRQDKIADYKQRLMATDRELSSESSWLKSYSSYLIYIDVKRDLNALKERIAKLTADGDTISERDEVAALLAKEKILTEQINLLRGHGETPFSTLMKPEEIGARPIIQNPLELFNGISFNKHLKEMFESYKKRQGELRQIVILLRKKEGLYKELLTVDENENYTQRYIEISSQLEKFETALETVDATLQVYEQRIDEITQSVKKEIKAQLYKMLNITIIIIILSLIFFLSKRVVKKYIIDNERFYMANKIINFTNFTLILIILLFNYIENVNYLVTVLGFASAGIAIAMKDWFMSMLGWLVIVLGGSIHVGDRVRVDKEGMKYVGDVLDISLLRITILEDITLTSYMQNRRAGRIVFIPNNYIFTQMIANYTHSSLKTVWDGIDITITFESNHKKAMHIAKDVTRKYSKGYTDITRKQLNKLRDKYSLKNTNVEPRIFSFVEENGICISAWYLTNAYATLTLRSVISTEILDAYLLEDDIEIAYPTQKLHLKSVDKHEPPFDTGADQV